MSSCVAPTQKRRIFKDAGRVCPVDYRISPDAFSGAPKQTCDVLYVVGGLYGNPFALDAIDDLVAAEDPSLHTLVVLNGDIHWFDKTADNFAMIEDRIMRYVPLVGNVEAELRRQTDVGVGCGCAYPECTSDEAVSRSNRIHKMLSMAMEQHPDQKERLQGRPATMIVSVCGHKVGITHGDEQLIGGWGCSRESLQDVLRQDELDQFLEQFGIEVFATTHTCAPVAMTLAHGAIINNGAAGLPNFESQHYGLVIRIARDIHEDSLFGTSWNGLHIDAVPVRYDHDAYLEWFDHLWDETSPAAISYRDRIVNGPTDHLVDSLLGGFMAGPTAQREANANSQASGVLNRTRSTERDVNLSLAKLLYFDDMLDDDAWRFTVKNPDTLQVNLTAQCNLACAHCHLGCSPARKEAMSRPVLEAILEVARNHAIHTIDVTGGAPELHPDLPWFLTEATKIVPRTMIRTNLVILDDEAYRSYAKLCADLGIEVVASLPNVFRAEAEAQRGRGTYDATIAQLRRLNQLGYGRDATHILDLVFNPQEPILPPNQDDLTEMYRRRLGTLGIDFTHLFAVANNPIGRYGASLIDSGAFDSYMTLLMDNFNPDTCPDLMCRHQLSIGWDGSIYDCDFNLALGLPARNESGEPLTIFQYQSDPSYSLKRPITFGNHCYACSAGHGSSCGGTLVQGA